MSSKNPDKQQSKGADERAERLRAALRANLQRRKAQGRARKAADAGAGQDSPAQDIGQEKGK